MAADLDPAGRLGLGAHAHAEFGVPVIGVTNTAFRTVTQAVPVLRGKDSIRPLFVTAAEMARHDAADMVSHMAGRHRLPDALPRADVLARPAPAITPVQALVAAWHLHVAVAVGAPPHCA